MSHSRKLIAPKLYRTLVATALITNGIFQLVVPALAEGTAAGQPIRGCLKSFEGSNFMLIASP